MVISVNVVGKLIGRKWHRVEKSIREGSWLKQSNLSIVEVIKFTYWWCQGLQQCQIKQQLGLRSHMAVDWDMFCGERETWRRNLEAGEKLLKLTSRR